MGYSVVDEAGASVYSASRLAGAELPALDVALRGAVSIARRLLDPLSELAGWGGGRGWEAKTVAMIVNFSCGAINARFVATVFLAELNALGPLPK